MEFFLGFVVGTVVGVFATLAVKAGRAPGLVMSQAPSGPEKTPSLIDQFIGDDPAAARVEELRQNLRVKFLHDETKVERAIRDERERTPGATEEELLKAAIYRWERDNR